VIFAGQVAGPDVTLPLVNRALSLAPAVAIGRLSYSLYLWHWPLLAMPHYLMGRVLPFKHTMVLLLFAVVFSYLSWQWIEQPFRRARAGIRPWRVVVVAVLASSLLVGFSALIVRRQGLPRRFSPEVLAFGKPTPRNTQWRHSGHPEADGVWRFKSAGLADRTDQRPAFLFWGDSHAIMISGVVNSVSKELGLSGLVALRDGRPPLFGLWRYLSRRPVDRYESVMAWNQAIRDTIRMRKPRNIILCAYWVAYLQMSVNDIRPARPGQPRSVPVRQLMLEGFEEILTLCEEIDSTLWILEDPPRQPYEPRHRAITAHLTGQPVDLIGVSKAEHEERNAPMKELLDQLKNKRLRTLDLSESFFEADGYSRVGTPTEAWYFDGDHLNEQAAEHLLRDTIMKLLEQMRAGE